MRLIRLITSNRGMSLIESMVALGVVSAGALAVMSLLSLSQKGQKGVSQATELSTLQALLTLTLQNPNHCGQTLQSAFASGTPLTLKADKPSIELKKVHSARKTANGRIVPGPAILDISESRRYGSITITKLAIEIEPEQLEAYLTLPSGTLLGSLQIEAERWSGSAGNPGSGPTSFGTQRISQSVPLALSLGAFANDEVRVTGCQALGGGSSTGGATVANEVSPEFCEKLGGSYVGPDSTSNSSAQCDLASKMCRQFGGTWDPNNTPSCSLAIQQTEGLYANTNYTTNSWINISPPPSALLPLKGMTGDNSAGLIVAGGSNATRVAYLRDYNSPIWNVVAPAPFPVQGLSGGNEYGPIVYNGTQVAYMRDYSANTWIRISTPAPWPLGGLAGNNTVGFVAFGSGVNNRKLAYVRDYSSGVWQNLADAPFPVDGIAGENTKGALILGKMGGESRVAYMRDYSSGIWNLLPPIPGSPRLTSIHGNNATGALVSDGTDVWYLNAYDAPVWTKLSRAPVVSAQFIAGENSRGAAVLGRK